MEEAGAVAEAERVLRETRLHSRRHLVEAFVSGQPTDAVMSEADAKAEVDRCRALLQHAEEVEAAIRDAISETEDSLPRHRDDIASAAGKLLSRTSVIGLVQQVHDAYATIRKCRLAIRELQPIAHLDDDLVRLAESSGPSDGARYGGGYVTDEEFVSAWTEAASHLLSDANAPLPDPNASRGNSVVGTNGNISTPVRAAPHRGSAPRRRAGAAAPLSRPARQQRASGKTAGMPVRRRASLRRPRDPVSGKWLTKEKAADQ